MIEARNISFQIGRKSLLQQVSLNAGAGELIAILGPNGAGKSTLLKVLAGLLKPSAGIVIFKEKPLPKWSANALARERAVLAQQSSLNTPFTAAEVVMMGRYPHFQGKPSADDEQVVQQSLQEAGAEHLAERIITTLSGGEQQRVHLARVLAQLEPTCQSAPASKPFHQKLLLLDEPVNNLDLQYQHGLLETVQRKARQGCTVITVLHELNLAARYADRVIILKDGQKLADGPAHDALGEELLSHVYGLPVRVLHQEGETLVVPLAPSPAALRFHTKKQRNPPAKRPRAVNE